MSSVIYSEYTPQADGSGIITETFEDGSHRIVRLPPPFVVDGGPRWNTDEDEAAIRAAEDRITRLDREGR
jgi:hypothetical protein